MQWLPDLFKSDKGIFAVLILLCTTVLFALGKLSSTEWKGLIEWVTVSYIAGKTVQGSVAVIKGTATTSAGVAAAHAAVAPIAPVEGAGETK